MSATDDDRIARISGWLSGELDPAAAIIGGDVTHGHRARRTPHA